MQSSVKGPWSRDEVEQFIQTSRYPLRLACTASDDYPRVVSLWFIYQQGQIFCALHKSSQLVALLRSNGRVGFEISTNEPPYLGVRGQADAALTELGGATMLKRLLNRYLGGLDSPLASWLLSRGEDELLLTLSPRRLFSWDYRQRMGEVAGPN